MNNSVIYEYEMVLLGNKTAISGFFFSQSPRQNEKLALEVIKYAVETYLRWTPEQMLRYFDADVVKRMRLESVMRFIQFPPEADEKKDYFIIANKIYPNEIKLNVKEMTLVTYRRVLNGDPRKFPKGFFDGSLGYLRAVICLQYVLTQKCTFNEIKDVYAAFAGPKGSKILKTYKLQAARLSMWDCAIDYLHDALPTANKNDLWYHYYRFKALNDKKKRDVENADTRHTKRCN